MRLSLNRADGIGGGGPWWHNAPMTVRWPVPLLAVLVACGTVATAPRIVLAQRATHDAETAEILKADADFARSVADRDRQRFLSFIADTTTFNGGLSSQLRGRQAVMETWEEFFKPDGPTLSWTPTGGQVIGGGDVGYTTGRSVLRERDRDGKIVERHSEYLTVWRRQRDGSWKVVFDTGSTLPPQ
jgi:ketosteroid isomerase-like protein